MSSDPRGAGGLLRVVERHGARQDFVHSTVPQCQSIFQPRLRDDFHDGDEMKSRLCLIHGGDEGDLAYLPRLKAEVPVTTVRLDEATRFADDFAMPLMVDVDLGDKDAVGRLRAILPPPSGCPRLFAAAVEERLERVQAGVLGATALVGRPVMAETLLPILVPVLRSEDLATDMGRGTVPVDAPGSASILAADAALGEMFSACLTGGLVDGDKLRSASSQVSGTIREVGLDAWMDTVRLHHGGTYQHCLLVTGIAVGFGTVLTMGARDIERLAMAGLMHDVGKAQVPVHLLDKPGRLEEEEFSVMKRHPEHGFAFLRRTDPTLDPSVLDAVVHHHEMLDGSGYPHGVAGGSIPDLTRIMTVCDIYGALAEKRAYKAPMATPEILSILGGLADKGKIERALVRALEAVVTGDHGLVVGSRGPVRRAS